MYDIDSAGQGSLDYSFDAGQGTTNTLVASVWSADFHPIDNSFISCGNDGNIKTWDYGSLTPTLTLNPLGLSADKMLSCKYDGEGNIGATNDGGYFFFYNMTTVTLSKSPQRSG